MKDGIVRLGQGWTWFKHRLLVVQKVACVWVTGLVYGASPGHVAFEEALPKKSYEIVGEYTFTLVDVNPHIQRWYVLEITLGAKKWRMHLESPGMAVSLTKTGLRMGQGGTGQESEFLCELWNGQELTFLKEDFSKYKSPYYPLCDKHLFIRLQRPARAKMSVIEWGSAWLRSTPLGESVINTLKPALVSLHEESGNQITPSVPATFPVTGGYQLGSRPGSSGEEEDSPDIADMLPVEPGKPYPQNESNHLGITLKLPQEHLTYGYWYETAMHPHIFTGLMQPGLVHPHLQETFVKQVATIGPQEKDKLVYLMAYDLKHYSIHYSAGTEQPPSEVTHANSGQSSVWKKSLAAVGHVPPYEVMGSVGTFIGGFKRQHSEITAGVHKGKVYGYVQMGVELTPLAPGLATLYQTLSGDVYMTPWPEDEVQQHSLRTKIVNARQNGVLLVENKQPTKWVNKWREGNWSASATGLGKSLRAGVCIQEQDKKKFLIFMAFTSATPSTMARVMQAYHCNQGMHLDMNALMYVHNALHKVNPDTSMVAEYLHTDMQYPPGNTEPRFLLENNSRDFFYITPR